MSSFLISPTGTFLLFWLILDANTWSNVGACILKTFKRKPAPLSATFFAVHRDVPGRSAVSTGQVEHSI